MRVDSAALVPVAVLTVGVALAAFVPLVAAAPPVDQGASAAATARRGTMTQVWHPAFPGPHEVQVGESVGGRPIVAVNRRGSLAAHRTVVAVGVIHGDERHGRLVTDRLMTVPLPADLDLWIVPTVNPDGEARGERKNGRGVDLNRNWPANWETGTYFSSGRYDSGPSPASEPETRAMMEFLGSVEPDVTIWYHSPWNRVDCDELRVGPTCADYAGAVGARSAFSPRPGTATDWVMTSGLGVSFVYEFARSAPPTGAVARHVGAVLALAPGSPTAFTATAHLTTA